MKIEPTLRWINDSNYDRTNNLRALKLWSQNPVIIIVCVCVIASANNIAFAGRYIV